MNTVTEAPRTPAPAAAPPPAGESIRRSPVKKRRPRRILWVLAAATVVAGTVVWFYEQSQPGVEYLTVCADRGDIDATVTTTGNLNAVVTVQVGSQVSGNIKALYADFNTKVKQGQLVAQIDPAPFQASVDQAKAVLNSAKAAALTGQALLAKAQSDLVSAQANVASQNANLVKAQSAVNLAESEADRRLALVQEKVISQEEYDTAKANYDQAVASVNAAAEQLRAAQAASDSAKKAVDVSQAQLQQSKAVVQQDAAALAQAQLNLDHTRILAPVDGTVQSRNMDVGQTVAASFQAPTIFVIAQDLTKMQVDTNVGEADVAALQLDQAASFTVDAYPGEVFSGKVSQIRQAPINVQNVITYDVVVAVPNPDLKLFPGMTANVTIFTKHVANALRIPKSALRFHPRTPAEAAKPVGPGPAPGQNGRAPQLQTAYILENGQPKPIRAKLGISDSTYVQVLDGLHEGQELIVGMKSASSGSTASQSQSGGGRRMGL